MALETTPPILSITLRKQLSRAFAGAMPSWVSRLHEVQHRTTDGMKCVVPGL